MVTESEILTRYSKRLVKFAHNEKPFISMCLQAVLSPQEQAKASEIRYIVSLLQQNVHILRQWHFKCNLLLHTFLQVKGKIGIFFQHCGTILHTQVEMNFTL